MHLFAKQINRRITQTNISHRTASVSRPTPEEKGGGEEKDGESLFIPSATACNIHTAETRNSPKKIQPHADSKQEAHMNNSLIHHPSAH